MSGMGECGKRITVKGKPARCWRRADHGAEGGHTPDGYFTRPGRPPVRVDDRPDSIRPRTAPRELDPELTDADREAGRLLREQAAGRAPRPRPAHPRPTREQAAQEGRAEQARAELAADPAWLDTARKAVVELAARVDTFTTDDVWEAGLAKPREPRALGPVIRRLINEGAITGTGAYVPSSYRHGAPIPVYRAAG
jgi:hypothetical protein